MELSFTDALLLLGVVQGGVVIFATFRRRSPNLLALRLFGLIIITLALSTLGAFRTYLLNDYLYSVQARLLFQFFPYFTFLLLGPAIYFYCKSLLNPAFRLQSKDRLHFLPVVLELAPFLLALVAALSYTFRTISLDQALRLTDHLGSTEFYMLIPRVVSISVYLWLSWKLLADHRSKTTAAVKRWLYRFLFIFTLLDVIYGVVTIVLVSPWSYLILEDFPYSLAYLVHYPIVGFMYFLTVKFMLQQIPWSNNSATISGIEAKAKKLCQLMEDEKLYRDPGLKLKQLSLRSGMTEKSISFILNQHYQKGFNDFVNEYRVQEALQKIQNDTLKQLSLEGIAFEVGFSSRSTFYRAFKKVTQKLPTDFMS